MKAVYFSQLVLSLLLFSACGDNSTTESSMSLQINSDTTSIDTDTINEQSDEVKNLTFEEYSKYVNELNKELPSLDSIFLTFEQHQSAFSQEERDSVYHLYVAFMNKLAFEFGDIECWDGGEEKADPYLPYGYNLHSGEGYCWLHVNTTVPSEKFKSYISQDLYNYGMLGEITARQYSADAGMMISYDEWGSVLTGLEDRIRKNKDSKYYGKFIAVYKNFLINFMYGMDNTPITDWEKPGLNEEVKNAYDKLIHDENHKTGKIIEAHIQRLEETDYDMSWDKRWALTTEEIEKYLEL